MISGAGGFDQGIGRGAADSRQVVHRSTIAVRRAGPQRHAPDEVLTQLASSVPDQTVASLGRRLRLDRAASFTVGNITTFRWKILDRRAVPAVIRLLEAEPIVLAAQPNYTYEVAQEARRRRSIRPGAFRPHRAQLKRVQAIDFARGE